MLPFCKNPVAPTQKYSLVHVDIRPYVDYRGTRLSPAFLTKSQSSVSTNTKNAFNQYAHPAIHVRSLAESSNRSGGAPTQESKFSFPTKESLKIKGTVILQRKSILDFNAQDAEIKDAFSEFIGRRVELQLVSNDIDSATGEGKRSGKAHLEDWIFKHDPIMADLGTSYSVTFSVDSSFGVPGAFLLENNHPDEFLLKSLTLEMPSNSKIYFPCNSWVYKSTIYKGPRIFFANQVYLPNQTPEGLEQLRLAELQQLRGDGTGERQTTDRIYDYDVYNDLGNPDKGEEYARPILGGSKEYPYPRRCRTGRKHTKADLASEEPLSVVQEVYVPRDEVFGQIKNSGFMGAIINAFAHGIIPLVEDKFKDGSFRSFEEIFDLYKTRLDLGEFPFQKISNELLKLQLKAPVELMREMTHPATQDESLLKFPTPQIIQENADAWILDEEFARQMLAGVNPNVIERLKEFPPVSKLDPNVYGPPTSSITARHIEHNLESLTVQEALRQNKLFIVDYHDVYLPYLEKINALKGKGYASRSIFFLTNEGILKPVAIELSLPGRTENEQAISRVFTPPPVTETDRMWNLAKAHANINDMGYNQVISHWLKTHAILEPFIIATHRHLSALHPLHALLVPHFKNTMNINALARKVLLNCDTGGFWFDGIVEKTTLSGRYSAEMSSAVYKSWRFDEQGLPADLIKRGMAVKDPSAKHGLRLFITDYPYAVDGLDIWFAIQSWVRDYVSIYYKDDMAVQHDTELQSWWREIREVGHGDKASETWWASMQTGGELEEVLGTLVWVASASHAAVNFGLYAYTGFMPNRPAMGRRLMPEEGSEEHRELLRDPETFFLHTVSSEAQATITMATNEILSQHAPDEEYLGQRTDSGWSSNEEVKAAFAKFSGRLADIELEMSMRNDDPELKNRYGSAKIPYTLLMPTSKEGLTGRGIPNSICI